MPTEGGWMSGEPTSMDFLACIAPPPAGPTAVDVNAPPLTAYALGIEHAPAPGATSRSTTPVTPTEGTSAGPARQSDPAPAQPGGTRPFGAELDACEIDDRGRPETVWSARARELGRGSLVFLSRRMCYPGRRLVLLIHLIDSKPAPLYGLVQGCEYEADGLYRVELRLMPLPDSGRLRDWVDSIIARR